MRAGWLLLALVGCDEADRAAPCAPREAPTAAAAARAWQPVGAAADPFGDHRPEAAACPTWALRVEGDAFEVDTGECAWLTATQPLLTDVAPCEEMGATVAHFQLFADGPAAAHVAIRVGDELAWEAEVPIPHPPQVYQPRWRLPRGAPAGTPVYFHVHNHGANSWFVADLQVSPAPPLVE